MTGAGLTGQVLHRENTLALQSVPQVGPDGSVLRQGCYPKPPAPGSADGGWQWQLGVPVGHYDPATAGSFTFPTQPRTGLVVVHWPPGIDLCVPRIPSTALTSRVAVPAV